MKANQSCLTCRRAPKDGCSHVECPNRRQLTASVVGAPVPTALRTPFGFYPVAGGVAYRSFPTNRED
jgi:hypothetical protein